MMMTKFFEFSLAGVVGIALTSTCGVSASISPAAGSSLSESIAKRSLFLARTSTETSLESLDDVLAPLKSKTRTGDVGDGLKRNRVLIRQSVRSPKLMPAGTPTDDDPIFSEESDDDQFLLAEPESATCDASFFDCIGSVECNSCFDEMKSNDIDWAGVSQRTECDTVISTLQKKGFCKSLGASKNSGRDLFCQTFQACVVFDGDYAGNSTDEIDCNTLTECNWPGMHSSFIGDGICQDAYFNTCYNTAVCGYDKGDCCAETCVKESKNTMLCGSDGYSCRDPTSKECDPTLTLLCPAESYKKTADDDGKSIPTCTPDQSLYKLVMYDSFGDGWGETSITITPTTGATSGQKLTPAYKGGLKKGSEGTEFVCLSLNPMCYHVELTGGTWGREASWYIRGYSEGSPSIASGGGSGSCDFSVAGGSCTNTCKGSSPHAPGQDPEYREFKHMVECIEDKCMLQVSACQADPTCAKCYGEDIPDYCYSIDSFLAITDCSMCKCTNIQDSFFCKDKQAPGIVVPEQKSGEKETKPLPCTPTETVSGGSALMDFSKCMDYEKNSLMKYDFDTNHFGALDAFEACAHSYNDSKNHGNHTALECLQILVNAMETPEVKGEPTPVIKQLATLLYKSGEKFCDCSKSASKDTPLCPSFYNFKTLVYESIDACASLDNIDCAAWDEFQPQCKVNLMAKFKSVNFAKKEQCEFMANNCGGSLPFPSFRRMDCQLELPASSWNFYTEYAKFCLTVPVPVPPPVGVRTTPPTPYKPVDPNIVPPPHAGVPTTDSKGKKPTYKSPDDKKKSHWFRNLLIISAIGGILYYVYKRQSDGFNFVRYRRMTNFGAAGAYGMSDNDMYSGLSLESSTNFEPPSLPPTPMSMPSNGGYGA